MAIHMTKVGEAEFERGLSSEAFRWEAMRLALILLYVGVGVFNVVALRSLRFAGLVSCWTIDDCKKKRGGGARGQTYRAVDERGPPHPVSAR